MEMSVFAERNAIGFSSIIVTISLIFTIAIDGSQCHHRHRYLNWCASLASRVLPLLLFLWQHDCFFGNMTASLATWQLLWLHGCLFGCMAKQGCHLSFLYYFCAR